MLFTLAQRKTVVEPSLSAEGGTGGERRGARTTASGKKPERQINVSPAFLLLKYNSESKPYRKAQCAPVNLAHIVVFF